MQRFSKQGKTDVRTRHSVLLLRMFPFPSFASAPAFTRPALYLTENKTNGIEIRYDGNDDATQTRLIVQKSTTSSQGQSNDSSIDRGIVFVKRDRNGTDTVLARVGLDGNVYTDGGFASGGINYDDPPSFSSENNDGSSSSPSPWRVDRDAFGMTFLVPRDPSWKVSVGSHDPPGASLHVRGGAVVADSLRGNLPFSDLVGVPHARPDGSVAGLVRLLDTLPSPSIPAGTLSPGLLDTAASTRALLTVRDETQQRVRRAGDTMTGDLTLRDAARLVLGPGGRLGVGISPNHTIDVLGDINFTGTLRKNGSEFPTEAPWKLKIAQGKVFTASDSFQVGIGTSDPKRALDIVGSVRAELFEGDGSGLRNLELGNLTRGILSVERGGTGSATLAQSKLLVGMGENPIASPTELHWDSQNRRLGIGVTDPEDALHVSGNIRASGSLYENSDARIKTNVCPIVGALEGTMRLQGVRFRKGTTTMPKDSYSMGLIAQDVLEVFPEAVHQDASTGLYSVSYGALVGALVEGMRDLRKEKDDQLRTLETRLHAVESHMEADRAAS